MPTVSSSSLQSQVFTDSPRPSPAAACHPGRFLTDPGCPPSPVVIRIPPPSPAVDYKTRNIPLVFCTPAHWLSILLSLPGHLTWECWRIQLSRECKLTVTLAYKRNGNQAQSFLKLHFLIPFPPQKPNHPGPCSCGKHTIRRTE